MSILQRGEAGTPLKKYLLFEFLYPHKKSDLENNQPKVEG
jgi:hypothetical protein